jgi:surfactin synthase thioesterase subunit
VRDRARFQADDEGVARDAIAELADEVAALDAEPFAFFGHCSGALIAFELTRELRRRDAPLPLQLLATSQPAPRLSRIPPSGERELAEGLLHDAQTRVVYRQAPDNVALTRELLGLSSVEADLLPELADGVALWKVGTRGFLVQHRLSAWEVPIVDTDRRMLDREARSG